MLPIPGQGLLFLLSLQNVFCCIQFEHRWQLKPLPMLQSLHVNDDQAQPDVALEEEGTGQGLKDWDWLKGCSQMAQFWARGRFGGSSTPWNNLSPMVRHLPSRVWWQFQTEVFYGTRQEDFPKATTDALMIYTGRVRLMTLKSCFKWTRIYIFK